MVQHNCNSNFDYDYDYKLEAIQYPKYPGIYFTTICSAELDISNRNFIVDSYRQKIRFVTTNLRASSVYHENF